MKSKQKFSFDQQYSIWNPSNRNKTHIPNNLACIKV